MTKRLTFLLLLMVLLGVIASRSYSQSTAVMMITVKVVSGGAVQSDLSTNMNLKKNKMVMGGLNFMYARHQSHLITMDKRVEIINEKGDTLKVAVSFKENISEQEGSAKYLIKGEIGKQASQSSGFYRGTLNASINYL